MAFSLVWKALNPPVAVAASAVPAIALMMAWVFLLGNEGTPLAIAFYTASAYLLTVFCIYLIRHPLRSVGASFLQGHRHLNRLVDNRALRKRVSNAASFGIDLLWGCWNMALGCITPSIWLVTVGACYLIFSLMRAAPIIAHAKALRSHAGTAPTPEAQRTFKRRFMQASGVLLVLSVFVLSGIVTLFMHEEGTVAYAGWLIYAIAAFTFYSLTRSIVDFVKCRACTHPLEVASSRMDFSIALVSIFPLEVAMFSSFATEQDALLMTVMPIITGSFIAVCLLAMGILSFRDAHKLRTQR